MKTNQKEAPASVYKELAKEISRTTEGVEYHEGEAETVKSGLRYRVNYNIEKHWDDLMDIEHEYLTVTSWEVLIDEDEEPTSVTMNPAEIEAYFDRKPEYMR